MLKHLHDEHDHYEHVIIFDRLKNEAYWSIRSQDVVTWCKSCSTCQFNANKHSTTAIRHILIFEFMFIIELNFLSFIKSSCTITDCKYVLLEVNYFSRFIWVKSYVCCFMIESADIMNNLITSIFEWLRALYSNNEKHFIEYEFEKLLKARKVVHFTASVTHSSFVNLIERMMQLMIEDIKKRCIQRDYSKTWTLNVIDETIIINIKKIRVHDHRSCDIMLDFIFKTIHHDIKSIKQSIWKNEMKNLSNHEQRMMMTLKTKNRFLALKAMIQYQDKIETQQKNNKNTIKERNLILIRDKVRNNQKSKKLNFRWKESRMIMFKTNHDLNAWTKSLYEIEKTTRHHINDIRLWIERSKNDDWNQIQLMNELRSEQKFERKNLTTAVIRTYDEIDSFRAFLTFEIKRKAMTFANYSNQRSLLL
jgi:hypothetical protein